METIIQLISNVGFPIAMCLLMFWQNTQMTKALDKNTEAIEGLKDLVKGGE